MRALDLLSGSVSSIAEYFVGKVEQTVMVIRSYRCGPASALLLGRILFLNFTFKVMAYKFSGRLTDLVRDVAQIQRKLDQFNLILPALSYARVYVWRERTTGDRVLVG